MRKVIVSIEKGNDFYSAFISAGMKDHAINGQGETRENAIVDFKVAFREMKNSYIDDGEAIPDELLNVKFEYR